jgi:hypothetical protein
MWRSPQLSINGVPIIFFKVQRTKGSNSIKLLVNDMEVHFTITPAGAEVMKGEVPADILPTLTDHVYVHFKPRKIKADANH